MAASGERERPPREGKRRRKRREPRPASSSRAAAVDPAEFDPAADESVVAEEPERRPSRMFCRECGAWRKNAVCIVCGADLLEVGVFAYEEDVDERAPGGVRVRTFLRIALGEVLPSLPGSLVCLLLTGLALGYQTLPLDIGSLHWPGVMFSSYACAFWLVERTRAAKTNTPDLDLTNVGPTLIRALFLLPIFAGLALGETDVAVTVAVVLFPVMPLLLGAFAAEDWREWSPPALWTAFRATDGYFRYAFVSTLAMAAAVAALGAIDHAAAWRAPVATLGVTVAGTLAGLARRSAEHVPEAGE